MKKLPIVSAIERMAERKGVSHGPVHVDLYKLLPTPGNATAAEAFAKNIFSVTRQVRYSNDSGNELDLVIFINGLPVLTFELKNSLTKQTLADAIVQYQTTREPRELLFQLGRWCPPSTAGGRGRRP